MSKAIPTPAEFRILYRRLWKFGGKAAAPSKQGVRVIHEKIREGFKENSSVRDGDKLIDIYERGLNTVQLFQVAVSRRGVEHKLIQNLLSMAYFQGKYKIRPPFFNRKLKPNQQQLHQEAYDEYFAMLEKLNGSLRVSLR
ncbi:hypothetical protein K7432_003286 [Basidiobolus ranarum]|uniref:Uncharacterized protein n=1 Tax=Basidiobolus ranarum TaxID=34480 RepID=A0ABR2W7B2_9FUNG